MAGRLALLIFFLLSLFATAQKVTNPPDRTGRKRRRCRKKAKNQ
jgi:hypothetical protein